MLCKAPYMLHGSIPTACGQCMPCRINRRRLWTHRIILESYTHPASCFVTLTYAPEHLPEGDTLVPRDVELWMKRLRKAVSPLKIRYFTVGEYGDETQRPHYHSAIFGLGSGDSETISRAWLKGFVTVKGLGYESAAYIAGYVTKKMTAKDDHRLNGRHPEFARMSNRPGIGATSMKVVAQSFENHYGYKFIAETGDVPHQLQHGQRKMPLGRYLRRILREEMGFIETEAQPGWLAEASLEMQEMYRTAKENPKNSDVWTHKQAFLALNKGKVASLENRSKIYRSRKSL